MVAGRVDPHPGDRLIVASTTCNARVLPTRPSTHTHAGPYGRQHQDWPAALRLHPGNLQQ